MSKNSIELSEQGSGVQPPAWENLNILTQQIAIFNMKINIIIAYKISWDKVS